MWLPPARGTAIALIAKSRVPRSASIEPPCSGTKSTVRPSWNATRQPPCWTESGNTAPPLCRAYSRPACSGSPHAMSRSSTGRPSSSSRTAPPTTHASCPLRISSAKSRIDDGAPRALRARVDPADELIRDRAGDARVRLGRHAVTEQGDRCPDRELPGQLDCERVHRDRPPPLLELPADTHRGARQIAAEAVAVPDR